MAQKSIQGSEKLAREIKRRRNALDLTIEKASLLAGIGTKTWSRYEAGESIRKDKCKGICKALNWRSFPDDETGQDEKTLLEEYRDHEAWSQFLADTYGSMAAMAFAAGSDILLDHIEQDLSDLARLPSDAHIGQLRTSFINEALPPQFLMRYDYDFLYRMKCSLLLLRRKAKLGIPMTAHSILEELIIYLCNEEARTLIEVAVGADDNIVAKEFDDAENWVFDMFDDADIITFLYSDAYLDEDHSFHFSRWNDQQFYMD